MPADVISFRKKTHPGTISRIRRTEIWHNFSPYNWQLEIGRKYPNGMNSIDGRHSGRAIEWVKQNAGPRPLIATSDRL